MSVPEIAQALELTKESAYTKAELEAYDRYWDTIRTERTLIADAEAKGKKEGFEMGTQKGKIEGKIEGKKEFVLKSFDNNIEISVISAINDLTMEEVRSILNDNKRL